MRFQRYLVYGLTQNTLSEIETKSLKVTSAMAISNKMIGVVGGVGSYASIDLIRKIYDYTVATSDQEHLPVCMLSIPHHIVDRTEFILGNISINPGFSIAEVISKLNSVGAEVIGIPCNTAHTPKIYNVITAKVASSCKLINMVKEVAKHLKLSFPTIRKVGILGTTGLIRGGVYAHYLSDYNIDVIYPSKEIQNLLVHPAIYNTTYGIKSFSNPVSPEALQNLSKAVSFLHGKGAEAIILACTEIPLALKGDSIQGVPLIDATTVLAKALINESMAKAKNIN